MSEYLTPLPVPDLSDIDPEPVQAILPSGVTDLDDDPVPSQSPAHAPTPPASIPCKPGLAHNNGQSFFVSCFMFIISSGSKDPDFTYHMPSHSF
jgi:hypothetical protein